MKTIYNHDSLLIKYEPEKKRNPYRIYRRYSGRERKLTEYADIISALCCLKEIYTDAIDTLTFEEQKAWMEERSS